MITETLQILDVTKCSVSGMQGHYFKSFLCIHLNTYLTSYSIFKAFNNFNPNYFK